MQYCGVRVPSRPALQRLAAGDAASDSDAAEPESPAQKRHIIITRLGGASVRLAAVQNAKKKKAAQKRRNKLEELPRSDRNGPLCGEQCDGVHSFYWSVGIGAPPPCHGHRACHGHLAPSPLSWRHGHLPSGCVTQLAQRRSPALQPAVQPSQHMHCKKSAVGLHGLLLQRMWASSRRVSDALGALSRQISLSQDHRHPSQDHSTGGNAPQDQAPTAGSVGISRPGGRGHA